MKKIASNEDKEKAYEKLVGLSITRQVYEFTIGKFQDKVYAKDNDKLIEEETQTFKELGNFKEAVHDYKVEFSKSLNKNKYLSLNELLKKVETSTGDLFKETKILLEKLDGKIKKGEIDKDYYRTYWECLSPLHDLSVIVNTIDKLNDNQEGKIIKAIKEGKVNYIEGKHCERISENDKEKKKDENYKDYQTCASYRSKKDCEVCEKNVVHAEMKIIRNILEKKELSSTASSSLMEIVDEAVGEEMSIDDDPLFEYIGISKLTCLPCKVAIDILNPRRKDQCTCGTHGSTYRGWEVPHNITEESKIKTLEELEKLCSYKKEASESTSELPTEFAEVNWRQKGKANIVYYGVYGVSSSSKNN